MRELRFRAWDKWQKKIIQPHDGDFIRWHAPSNWKEFLEVMQFTGLKDKNGREIYEGDILRFEWEGETIVTQPVGWTNELCCFTGAIGLGWVIPEDLFCANAEYEICGNIYENPELLQTKE